MQKNIIIIAIGLGALILIMLAVLILVPGPKLKPTEPSTVLSPPQSPPETLISKAMNIQSPAFNNGGVIPVKYTCAGQNISPELRIDGVPENAKSLVLTMDDPDAPKSIRPDGVWDHWLVWNIPPQTSVISEGATPEGVVGKNTGGRFGYQSPCPPDREHRYFFKIYALDTELDLPKETTTKNNLLAVMEGHILAQAELMGRYNRR